jgi:hypothetical protein
MSQAETLRQRLKSCPRGHAGWRDFEDFDNSTNWGKLREEFSAKIIVCEFKNYDTEIGQEEAAQTGSYLHDHIGKLGFMICSKLPDRGAHEKRNIIYTQEKKVILFITVDHLLEMIAYRELEEDPSNVIIDLIDSFRMQYQ